LLTGLINKAIVQTVKSKTTKHNRDKKCRQKIDTMVEEGLDSKAAVYNMMEGIIVEMISTEMSASDAVDKMIYNGLETTAANCIMIERVISEI